MAIKTRQTTATGVTNNNAPLTNAELDNNFVELQQNKVDASGDTITGDLSFGDDVEIQLGDLSGGDFRMFHDGFHTRLYNNTGDLHIRNLSDDKKVIIQTDDGSGGSTNYFIADGNTGEAQLLHLGSEKLATSSTGIDITGEVKADKFTNDEALPDVRPSLLLDFANQKALDPRITFTRGSTATYWDGKTTTKAEENFYEYSQDFGNTWSSNAVGVLTNNTTAPDGTTTAEKIYSDTSSSYHYTTQNNYVPAGVYTSSVYIKAAGYNYAGIRFTADSFSGTRYAVVIDLTNGTFVDDYTVGSPSYTPSYAITSVGNDWYRLSVTVEQTATSGYMNTSIFLTDDSTPTWATVGLPTFTGDGSSGVFLWGAQLEQRSSATAYTATTANPIVKYQPTLQTAASGEARFDHDPATGESKGLLIEESRVNYITSSENLAGSGGEAGNDGYISDIAVAPDGTLTAGKLLQTDGTSSRQRRYDLSGLSTANQTVTASVYVKSDGSWQYAMVMLSDNSARRSSVTVDLDTGEITDAGPTGSGAGLYDNSSVEDAGNGWYRISLTGRSATGDVQYYLNVGMSNTATPSDKDYPTFTGNRYKGILVWGKQLEVGYFPTSYIPTSGSTVTRSGEACYSLDSAFTPSGTFTALAKASLPYDNTVANINASMFSFGPDRIQLRYDDGFGAQFLVYNPSAVVDLNAGTSSVNSGMTAVQIGQNDFKFSSAGSTVQTDAGGIFDAPETMYIGNLSNSSEYLNGHIQKIAFYTASLSNATLQAMTEE
jgi:hypothetical protein